MSSFTSLLPSLQATLAEQRIRVPTEIQAQTLTPLLDGRSVIGVSETGSGKTLAYALPLLHQLKTLENNGSAVAGSGRPRGLIVVPGRELGEQVSRVLKGLTHATRLRVRTTLGGTKKQVARQTVSGNFEVLVATPGRLTQLLDSKELHLDDVRTVVFDEADQLMDSGFLPVAKRILDDCPKAVQRVLFTATLPAKLERVMHSLFRKPPVDVRTHGSQQTVSTLKTVDKPVTGGKRFPVLRGILLAAPKSPTILFGNTRDQCDKIAEWLHEQDLPFVSYRGQMDRQERRRNLARFRNGEVNLLLTTDLGGRGLDIEQVERVVNVHLPEDLDNYLHRVGRTARAGREGTVFNLVTDRDQPLMDKVAKREAKRVKRAERQS
jgi:superfamily II DNA/RNA helicase